MYRISYAIIIGCLSSLMTAAQHAATLSSAPPLIVPPDSGSLNTPPTDLGSPGLFWFPFIEWGQTGEITIEIPVLSTPGESGPAVTHNVFLGVDNETSDTWIRFEIEVAGPASFSLNNPLSPITIDRTADAPQASLSAITFQGFGQGPDAWVSNPGSSTITFGLDVVPPTANEPVLLTLRPVAVPEPTTGVMLALASLLTCRRRNRRDV